jgi:hypothetical protein
LKGRIGVIFRLKAYVDHKLASRLIRGLFAVVIATLAYGVSGNPVMAADQPKQAKTGPGGTDYVAGDIVKRAIGSFETPSLVFYAGGASAGASAPRPVVIFLHPWGAANPQLYGAWIEHLVRKGNLVIWPRFQEPNRVRIHDGMGNLTAALKDAFAILGNDRDVRPDLNRVVAVGHLSGAVMAMNITAIAAANGLPVPKLTMAVMPGGVAKDAKARGILLADLSQIPAESMIVTIIGDRDQIPSDRVARLFLREAKNVLPSRKLFMRIASDDHGFPAMSASLASAGAPKEDYDIANIKLPPEQPRDPKLPRKASWRWTSDMALTGEQSVLVAQIGNNLVDALDYNGFWRVLDMTMEAVFSGQDAVALRTNPRLIDMGQWSNGWPMKRMGAEVPRDAQPAAPNAPAAGTAPAPRRP